MSHDLLLDSDVTYVDLLAGLPEGIRVVQSYGLTGQGALAYRHTTRLFKEGTEHVLLSDVCGNTLWCHPANAHDVKCDTADEIGEPAFDHYGMQGSPVHFVAAFAALGIELYDACDLQTYVFGRPCRHCGLEESAPKEPS